MIYSDPAFWISIVSLTIAGISLGWNIYKEFMKPRLKLLLILRPDNLIISATNRGPGKITIRNQAFLKSRWALLKKLLKKDPYEYIKIASSKMRHEVYKIFKVLGVQFPCLFSHRHWI